MKPTLFFSMLFAANLSMAGEPLIVPPPALTCEYIIEMEKAGKFIASDNKCANDDAACAVLQKQQKTYVMTKFAETEGGPFTEISEELFKQMNEDMEGVYSVGVQIGEYFLDGVNFGFGGGNSGEMYFIKGTLNLTNISYMDGSLYVGEDYCEIEEDINTLIPVKKETRMERLKRIGVID